jgi:hypothetical protein
MLRLILRRLQGAPATRLLEVDDGWQAGRDITVSVGPFMWMDIRVLVEEHNSGKCLVRVGQRLRATVAATAAVVAAAAVWAGVVLSPGPGAGWLLAAGGALAAAAVARSAWRLGHVGTEVLQTLRAVADETRMLAMDEPRPRVSTGIPAPAGVAPSVRFVTVSEAAGAAPAQTERIPPRIPRPVPARMKMDLRKQERDKLRGSGLR